MHLQRYMRVRIAVVLMLITAFIFPAFAQIESKASNARPSLQRNGLTLQARGIHVSVVALRDDVLRVRYWRGLAMPEDASWAVLPEARKSSVRVDPLKDKAGFSTSALRVEVNKATLQVTVFDSKGNVLQEDAAPIDFRGDSFELSRKMTLD